MFLFSMLVIGLLIWLFIVRGRSAKQFFWFSLVLLVLVCTLAALATEKNFGVNQAEAATTSVRQESTTRGHSFFVNSSSRSHLGGGLMGGK